MGRGRGTDGGALGDRVDLVEKTEAAMKGLYIGNLVSGGDRLGLPLDEVTKATAILGIRESGKSYLGLVMAEELCKIRQPWVALDPVGNWWGLRSRPDGKPGGFPVVVFGGERADVEIEKGDGRKIAEAVIAENVFAVIDLKKTSKTIWRTFVRDFVAALLEVEAKIPRKIFIEESQEFIPQTASYQLGRECSEIVERLVTLGGNYGYGATLLGQRSAAIAKAALSQCETVFAFATQSSHDRDSYKNWIKSTGAHFDETMLTDLANLETGTCYAWSPRFLKLFEKIKVRPRETFHPRDSRRLGVPLRDVELAPVDEFVARVRKQLTKSVASVPVPPRLVQAAEDIRELAKNPKLKRILHGANAGVSNALAGASDALTEERHRVAELALENGNLKKQVTNFRDELDRERRLRARSEDRVALCRKALEPYWTMLKRLFDEITPVDEGASPVDEGAYAPWLERAGRGVNRRLLETLMKRGELTRTQLAGLSVVGPRTTTFRDGLSWLRRHGLAETEGELVRLRKL